MTPLKAQLSPFTQPQYHILQRFLCTMPRFPIVAVKSQRITSFRSIHNACLSPCDATDAQICSQIRKGHIQSKIDGFIPHFLQHQTTSTSNIYIIVIGCCAGKCLITSRASRFFIIPLLSSAIPPFNDFMPI